MTKNRSLKNLPFPQNKELTISFGDDSVPVLFIPVLNHPLSSNLYYAIQPYGKHKGEAFTCSREEDMEISCCSPSIRDVKPRPLDPCDLYQQMQIAANGDKSCFHATSVAPDGFPPNFLRIKSWSISAWTPTNYKFPLGEAPGLNTSLREVLPDFRMITDLPSEPIVVGKWYCPFMFVKERGTLRDQMKRSTFYEMTLERGWERFFACRNNYNTDGNSMIVDRTIEREVVFVDGNKAVIDDSNVSAEGVIWFIIVGNSTREESSSVGLRVEIIERMKWEQERAGWVVGKNNQVRVHKEEKFGEVGEWREYGCYVLVEKFVLKRMDGTPVMSYHFRHTRHIKGKWE